MGKTKMKYIKLNSLLILIMLSVSLIKTSQSYSENVELEELMQNNADQYDDTELSKFYEKENHKFNNHNIDNDLPSNTNTQKTEEIKLIETSQRKKAPKKKTTKKSKKGKKPLKKKPAIKFQDSFKHISAPKKQKKY